MHALIALLRKDLVLHFSNRRALLMSLVAPIVIAAFFGSLFGGSGTKPQHIAVGLTDLDRSAVSAGVVAALRADTTFALQELDADAAAAQVRSGKLRAAITLPAGFGAQATGALFGAAAKPEIVLTVDPSQGMALPLVRGLLAQHVMRPVSAAAFGGPGGAGAAGAADAGAASVPAAALTMPGMQRMGGMSLPYTTREVEAGAGLQAAGYNGYAHSFAGMGVQFILLMGVEMGIGLLLMRRLGLWKRLRAAPLSRAQLLGSRIASCALIALFTFIVIGAVAMAVFGVRVLGSVPGLLAVLLAFSLLTASFGLMIAALGRTPETTRGLAILATLMLVMLGGAWVPSFIFPPWLQTVSAWTPTHWAIEGLDGMTWRGLPLQAALLPVAVLLGFSALFAAIALWRFDWEE